MRARGAAPARGQRLGRGFERTVHRHAGRAKRVERGQPLFGIDGVQDERLAVAPNDVGEVARRAFLAASQLRRRDADVAAEVAGEDHRADVRVGETDVDHARDDFGLLLGLTREVDRVRDAAARGQNLRQPALRRFAEGRHEQAGAISGVAHDRGVAAAVGDDGHGPRSKRRQRCERDGSVPRVLALRGPNDAALPEGGVDDAPFAGEHAGVRERGAPAALGVAGFHDDHRLWRWMAPHQLPQRTALERAEALEVGDDDLRLRIREEIVEVLRNADVGRVADGDELAEAETFFTRELAERQRHVAALRDQRDRSARHVPADGVDPARRAEVSGAVRPDQACAGRVRDADERLLGSLALGARLPEAGCNDDDPAGAGRDGVGDRGRNEVGTDEDYRELDGARDVPYIRIGLPAEDLRRRGVDRIERPGEAALHHAPPAAPPRLVLDGGGADDGDAGRIEQRVERMPHRFLNCGTRFSENARGPSLASSVSCMSAVTAA